MYCLVGMYKPEYQSFFSPFELQHPAKGKENLRKTFDAQCRWLTLDFHPLIAIYQAKLEYMHGISGHPSYLLLK